MTKLVRFQIGTMTVMLGALMAMQASVPPPADAQEFTWRMNNGLPETRQESKFYEGFAEEIYEMTDGRLRINVYHGGSLGLADADVLRWLPAGAVEMSFIWGSWVGRDAPELAAAYAQGAVGEREEHIQVLPELVDIYNEAVQRWGLVPVGINNTTLFDISVFCRGEPVSTLDDLRDRKLRVLSADQVRTFQRLGIAGQIIPQNELYTAMQTGVVDCALYPAQIAHTISLQEVTDSAVFLHPLAAMPYVVVVPEQVWQTLPEDIQKVVLEAGRNLDERSREFALDHSHELAAREWLEEKGVAWLGDLPEEDKQAFLEASAETWLEVATEAGVQALAYRERILKALGRD